MNHIYSDKPENSRVFVPGNTATKRAIVSPVCLNDSRPKAAQLQMLQHDNRSQALAKRNIPQDDSSPIKANNTGLPDSLKLVIENLSGHPMDDVKVHYNSVKPAQLQAHAYAQGTQIHIAAGQEKHLPHEAWHVVQQKQGRVQPTVQMKGVFLNDDRGLEKEADRMGDKALHQNNPGINVKSSSRSIKNGVGTLQFSRPAGKDAGFANMNKSGGSNSSGSKNKGHSQASTSAASSSSAATPGAAAAAATERQTTTFNKKMNSKSKKVMEADMMIIDSTDPSTFVHLTRDVVEGGAGHQSFPEDQIAGVKAQGHLIDIPEVDGKMKNEKIIPQANLTDFKDKVNAHITLEGRYKQVMVNIAETGRDNKEEIKKGPPVSKKYKNLNFKAADDKEEELEPTIATAANITKEILKASGNNDMLQIAQEIEAKTLAYAKDLKKRAAGLIGKHLYNYGGDKWD